MDRAGSLKGAPGPGNVAGPAAGRIVEWLRKNSHRLARFHSSHNIARKAMQEVGLRPRDVAVGQVAEFIRHCLKTQRERSVATPAMLLERWNDAPDRRLMDGLHRAMTAGLRIADHLEKIVEPWLACHLVPQAAFGLECGARFWLHVKAVRGGLPRYERTMTYDYEWHHRWPDKGFIHTFYLPVSGSMRVLLERQKQVPLPARLVWVGPPSGSGQRDGVQVAQDRRASLRLEPVRLFRMGPLWLSARPDRADDAGFLEQLFSIWQQSQDPALAAKLFKGELLTRTALFTAADMAAIWGVDEAEACRRMAALLRKAATDELLTDIRWGSYIYGGLRRLEEPGLFLGPVLVDGKTASLLLWSSFDPGLSMVMALRLATA